MNLAYKKILGKFTKVLGFGKSPPPCWERFPNNIVFFFWQRTLWWWMMFVFMGLMFVLSVCCVLWLLCVLCLFELFISGKADECWWWLMALDGPDGPRRKGSGWTHPPFCPRSLSNGPACVFYSTVFLILYYFVFLVFYCIVFLILHRIIFCILYCVVYFK